MADKISMQKGTVSKVLKYIKKYRFLLVLSLALAAASVALTLYVPVLIGDAIDYIIGENNVDFAAVTEYLIKITVIVCVTALFQWIMNTINNKIQ